MRGRIPFRHDLRLAGATFWLSLAVFALFAVLPYCPLSPRVRDALYMVQMLGETAFTSAHFLLYDFLFPILLVLQILLVFGETFERNNRAFFYTLPVGRLHVLSGRYFRLLGSLLAAYTLSLSAVYFALREGLPSGVSLPAFLCASLPVPIFLCGLALFTLVLFHELFYSCAVCLGLAAVDFMSRGTLFGWCGLYLNTFSPNALFTKPYFANRIGLTAVGLLLVLCANLLYLNRRYRAAC